MNKRIILICLAIAFCNNVFCKYADHRGRNTDSLEAVLATHPTDPKILANIYEELMWGYLQTDGKKSADYASKALAISEMNNFLITKIVSSRILGQHFYAVEMYDSALHYYNISLATIDKMNGDEHYTQTVIDDNYSIIYGTIGNLYNIQDKIDTAEMYYQKALDIFKKYDYNESLSILYYNMAEMYAEFNQDKASEYYNLSYESAEKTGDSLMLTGQLRGLSGIYYRQGKYDKALSYLEKAEEYFSKHDEERQNYIETLVSKAWIRLYGFNDKKGTEECITQAMDLMRKTAVERRQAELNEQSKVYDLQIKDLQLAALAKEKRMYRTIMSFALIGIILLIVLIITLLKINKKQKQLLTTKKELDTQTILRTQTEDVLNETISELKSHDADIKLTDRERQVLKLIIEGHTNPEIAEMIFLSPETIKWYRKKLLVKFGVANSAALVAKAKDMGIVM